MAISSVRCPVAQTMVTVVTDLEGATTQVICSELDQPTGSCRIKRGAEQGGMLTQLLERLSEGTLGSRSVACHLL